MNFFKSTKRGSDSLDIRCRCAQSEYRLSALAVIKTKELILIMFVSSSLRSIIAELRLQVCYSNKKIIKICTSFH